MQPNEEYKEWIEKSEDNLRWAEDNLREENFPLVCFLSQQAVELILKGFLYKNEIISPKVHKLVDIYKVCEKSGLKLSEGQNEKLNSLTDYYFESRYPDTLNRELDNKGVAEEALESARKIVDEVKNQLL